MEEYTYIRTIGEGAYGDVWLSQRRGDTFCAVKVFKQAHEDEEVKALAKREARILQTIDHVNCIKLLDAFKSKTGRVYLVFEYVEKSVFAELDANPHGLPPRTTKLIAWQLLRAAAYLHGRKVVHRDIKPANILMSSDLFVKVCDFGFARTVQCGPHDQQPLSSYCVTRWYRPPEVLVSDDYGPSADVWSIGCTLAEIATGRPLFPGSSSADQLWRIMRCLGPIDPQHLTRMLADDRIRNVGIPPLHRTLRQRLPRLEPGLFQLVESCLQTTPACRPTAEDLLQMPYFWDVPHLVANTPLEPLYLDQCRKGPRGCSLQPLAHRYPVAEAPQLQPLQGEQELSLIPPATNARAEAQWQQQTRLPSTDGVRCGRQLQEQAVVALAAQEDSASRAPIAVSSVHPAAELSLPATAPDLVATAAEATGLLRVDGPVPPPLTPAPQHQNAGFAASKPTDNITCVITPLKGSCGTRDSCGAGPGEGGDVVGGDVCGLNVSASGSLVACRTGTAVGSKEEHHVAGVSPSTQGDDGPGLSLPHTNESRSPRLRDPPPVPTPLQEALPSSAPLLSVSSGAQVKRPPAPPPPPGLTQQLQHQEHQRLQQQQQETQAQLGASGSGNACHNATSTSCQAALDLALAGDMGSVFNTPPAAAAANATSPAIAEEDESYCGLSKQRCTISQGPASLVIPHSPTATQPSYYPVYRSLLLGDGVQLGPEDASRVLVTEGDPAILSINNNASDVINSPASAAITFSSAVLAAPDCETVITDHTLSPRSATAQVMQVGAKRGFAGGVRRGDGGSRAAGNVYTSDTEPMHLPGEAVVSAVGLRTAVQRRRAAAEVGSSLQLSQELQQQHLNVWAAPRLPQKRAVQCLGSGAGGLGGVSGGVLSHGLICGIESGSWAATTWSHALMAGSNAGRESCGGSGSGSHCVYRRPAGNLSAQRKVVGSRSAQHAASSWRDSFNDAGNITSTGFAFPTLAMIGAGRMSGSGPSGRQVSELLFSRASSQALSNHPSPLDTIPLGDILTPVGAPEMPSYAGCLPPHRRPPPSQSPWAPPSRGNSDSLTLIKMPFSQRTAVVPLTAPAARSSSQHDLASQQHPQQHHNRDDTDSGTRSSADAYVGSGSLPRGLAGALEKVLGRLGRSAGSASSSAPVVVDGGGGGGSSSSSSSKRAMLRPQPGTRSRLGGSATWDAAACSAATLSVPTSGTSLSPHSSALPTHNSVTQPSAALPVRCQESIAALLSTGVQISPVDSAAGTSSTPGAAIFSGAQQDTWPFLRPSNTPQTLAMGAAKPCEDGVTSTRSVIVTSTKLPAGPAASQGVGVSHSRDRPNLVGLLLEEGGSAAVVRYGVLGDRFSSPGDVAVEKANLGAKKSRITMKGLWKRMKKALRMSPTAASSAASSSR